MNNEQWHVSRDKCPCCGKPTQILTTEEYDDLGQVQEYEVAERCPKCGWRVSFDDG